MASPPVNPADLTMLRDLYDTKLAQGSGSDYVRGLMNERFEDALASWQSDQAAQMMDAVPSMPLGSHMIEGSDPFFPNAPVRKYDAGGPVEPLDTPYVDYGTYGSPNQTFQTPPSHAAGDLPAQVYGEGGKVITSAAKKLENLIRRFREPVASINQVEEPIFTYDEIGRIVPAIRVIDTRGRTSVYEAQRGETHEQASQAVPRRVNDNFKNEFDDGFYDPVAKRYYTRNEMSDRMGPREAGELSDVQEGHLNWELPENYAHGGPYRLAGWGHEPEPPGVSFSHVHQSGPMHYGSSGGFEEGGRITPTPEQRREIRINRAHDNRWSAQRIRDEAERDPGAYWRDAATQLPHGVASTAELAGLPGSVLDALEISGGKYGSHFPLPTAEGIHGGLESIFGAPRGSGGRASYGVGSLLPMMGIPELAPSRLGHAGNALALGSVLGETPGYADGGEVRGYAEGGRRIAAMAKYIADRFGKTQARRFERAGDETDLSRFDNLALRELFDPARSGLLTSMPPGEFEKYALGLPASSKDVVPYPRWENIPPSKERYKEDWSHPERMTQDNYVKLLGKHIDARGMTEPPSLWMFRHPEDMTAIEGHEGRHRMRALDSLGDENSLVHLLPVNVGEYRHPINERVPILQDKYFPEGKDTLILPEGRTPADPSGSSMFNYRPLSPLPNEAFAEGGQVYMEKGGPLSGLIKRGAKELKEFVGRLREPDGGFTWQPHTNDQPGSGYAVSIFPERSHVLDSKDVTTEALHDYLRRNEDLLSDPINHFGAWHDPETGKAHLDISVVTPQEAWAQELARRHNQKTYFDFSDFSSHPPPYEEIPTYKKGGVVDAVEKLVKSWRTSRAEALDAEKKILNRGTDERGDFVSPEIDPKLQTVDDPRRVMFPKIYADPRDVVGWAKNALVPDPGTEGSMYRLFGHTRQSLDELSQGNRAFDISRPPSMRPFVRPEAGTGADVSPQVLTNRNAKRMLDVLDLGRQDPDLRQMRSWYELGPMYDRMEHLGELDTAKSGLNARMGVMSPQSSPAREIPRGFLAHYLSGQGRLEDFVKYGGLTSDLKQGRSDLPEEFLRDDLGHKAHGTHFPNLWEYENLGRLWPSPKTHKVGTYVAASDPVLPYGEMPVADSHFTRMFGYPDVRTARTKAVLGQQMSNPEYGEAAPWWNKKVASELDERPRDAQALGWGLFGKATGVRAIGSPKLELISDFMDEVARSRGISPEMARDQLLTREIGGKSRGGPVEDDFNLYQSQFYARGGPVENDFWNQYQSQYFNEGGYVNG